MLDIINHQTNNKMKTFKLFGMALLAIIMSVGFIACSSDDDNEETGGNTSLVGKWKSEWLGETADEKTFDLNNTEVAEVYSYYTFNSDGTGYELYNGTRRYEIQWEILDEVLYVHFDGSTDRFKILKSNKKVMYVQRLNNYKTYIKFVRM